MPPKPPLPDEIEFDQPLTLLELPGGNLNSESIMWYFMSSPFFDGASNNVALFTQLHNTPGGQAILDSRIKFQEALQTRYPLGLQFIVVEEPQGPGQGWVIQRQMKERVVEEGKERVKVEIQGTYYTVGTRILMAPSLLDVLQTRLLTTSVYLQEVFEISKSMSHYSPATGHTYLPPSYEAAPKVIASSRLGTPGLEAETSSQAGGSQPVVGTETSETEFSNGFFMSSLIMTQRHGNEYMDENPLVGEPGAFVYGTTTRQVEARNKAQAEKAALSSQASASNIQSTTLTVPPKGTESGANTPKPSATPKPVPTPLPTDIAGPSRKGSVSGVTKLSKKERRKSKGLASPITPNAPTGPPGP
jgi:mediator of RNA polymerase II transcription subunit 6